MVYQIDSVTLDLKPITRFSCGTVPERLNVHDSLLIVYAAGELLFQPRAGGKQHRFRQLMPYSTSELIGMETTTNFLWLVHASGVFRVPLTALYQKTTPSVRPLAIEGVDAEGNGYNLPAGSGPLRVLLGYIDVLTAHQLRYSYRLNEASWTKSSRIADGFTLSNLAAGQYTLDVRIVQGNQVLNTRSLSFSIAPHWHESTWFWMAVFLVVLAGTVQFFRHRISRLKKQNALNQALNEAQLTALKAQMNPHFLFNILNSIQGLVLKEDKMRANKIMSEFSVFLRKTLNYSGKAYIALQDEIEMLENYLKLEQHRFSDSFTYELKVESSLEDYLHLQIPPLLIQPFVENAINHGLLHKKHDRLLQIHFSGNAKELVCVLEDNGIGRKRAAEIQQKSKKHRSFASEASIRRVELLQSPEQTKPSIQIEDLYHANQQPAGTRVTLSLPLIQPV